MSLLTAGIEHLPGRTAGKSYRRHLQNISEEITISVGLHSNLYCFPYSMNSPRQGSHPWKAETTFPGFICCPWNALGLLPDTDGQPLQSLLISSTLPRYTLNTLAGYEISSWKHLFIFVQKILSYGFRFTFSEAGIIVIDSPSFLFHLNYTYVYMYRRETEKCATSFSSLLHHFLFLCSLTRNTDALLLHYNHSGMTIQCPVTLEQNGNWVKTSSRIQWSLKISTSHSMFLSGNCHSPQKSIVVNWQVLTVSNSWSYYSRATNFIFRLYVEKKNKLYKWMYIHRHLTPLCLQSLIKEEKLKNPHTTYAYKVVGKKKY